MQQHAFTTEPYLRARFARIGRSMGLRADDLGAFGVWQRELRARLWAIAGLDTLIPCALDPVADDPVDVGDHIRQRVVIQTEPSIAMPCYVLTPKQRAIGERRPAIIAPHGHGGGGKAAVAGVREETSIARAIDEYHYDYGVQLVQQGFVVLCPDARGFGERREASMQQENLLSGSCHVLNNMAIPLGQTVIGMWTWDLMRLVDYAVTRDDCDRDRLAVAGLSGGGWQALWLAALDERIRCAVVSGYFYGIEEALLQLNRNCSCNYVPGLWQLVDQGDFGALIAPRPLHIESGSRDPLNGPSGLANVAAQIAIARRAYALHGMPELPAHSVFEGEHRWDGSATIPWLVEQLRAPIN